MAYDRNPTWRDWPDKTTPVTAYSLERIENGIEDASLTADLALQTAAETRAALDAASSTTRVSLDTDDTPYFDTAGTTGVSLDADGTPYIL